MERYYDDYNRWLAHESAIEHYLFITNEQLRDILGLIRDKKWPDGRFGDHECNVWSLIREELGIKY